MKKKIKSCDCCLDGWRYDKESGWAACLQCNEEGNYQPLDSFQNIWEIKQPKYYPLSKFVGVIKIGGD